MSSELIPDYQIEVLLIWDLLVFFNLMHCASYTVSGDHEVVLVDASVPLRIVKTVIVSFLSVCQAQMFTLFFSFWL